MKTKETPKCKVKDCNDAIVYKKRGICDKHYKRLRRHGSYDLPICESDQLIKDGLIKCAICNENKPINEFHNDNSKHTGKSIYCRTCYGKKRRELYKQNKEHHRKLFVMRKYKLTQEQLNDMFITQDSKCAICDLKTDDLYIDHDHKSGKVRGLLCSKCNFGVGNFNDEITLLEKAIEYLKGNKNERTSNNTTN